MRGKTQGDTRGKEQRAPAFVRATLADGEDLLRAFACDREGRWFFVGWFGANDQPSFDRLWGTYAETVLLDETGEERSRYIREKTG